MSDRKLDQYVFPVPVCDCNSCQPSFDLLCSNSSDPDNGSARIAHSSANASRNLLSGNIRTGQKSQQEQRQRFRATHTSPIRPQESRLISQNNLSSALWKTQDRIRPQIEVRRL